MWVIIRTLKGKHSFPTESGQWSQDRKDAERFDRYDYAVYKSFHECLSNSENGLTDLFATQTRPPPPNKMLPLSGTT